MISVTYFTIKIYWYFTVIYKLNLLLKKKNNYKNYPLLTDFACFFNLSF